MPSTSARGYAVRGVRDADNHRDRVRCTHAPALTRLANYACLRAHSDRSLYVHTKNQPTIAYEARQRQRCVRDHDRRSECECKCECVTYHHITECARTRHGVARRAYRCARCNRVKEHRIASNTPISTSQKQCNVRGRMHSKASDNLIGIGLIRSSRVAIGPLDWQPQVEE